MRKAALDIGVNFAVLIILGLIILGFALMFVLDVFKFAHEKVPDSAPEIIFHATPDNPLYPEQKPLELKPGESAELLVSVYNAEWSDEEDILLAFDMCASEDGLFEGGIKLSSITQRIPRESDKGYLAIIKATDTVLPGTYVCTVQAGIPNADTRFIVTDLPYHSRQVSIEVKG